MASPKIYGISLGPGDPDLITLKGLDLLRQADKIYYPGSLFADGSKYSYAQSILSHYELDENKMEGFFLQMSLDRTAAEALYQSTFELIQQDYEAGLTIAVVSEGDLSTYSSFSYLLKRFQTANLLVELVPGITSYSLGAAVGQQPLSLQNEKMVILPRIHSAEALQEAITQYDMVVLLKIRSVMAVITEVIAGNDCQIQYSERLGTSEQFITTNWEEVQNRTIPYFSLMTIKK